MSAVTRAQHRACAIPLLAWRHQSECELAHARQPKGARRRVIDSGSQSAVTFAALFVQAVDHELRPIAGQDFLFGGLFLAAVYPFFFLRSFCRQFLILRRDDGRLISFGGAVQTIDNELGTIARQDFLLGGLSMTVVDFLFFLRPLCSHVLVLGCDGGRLALGLPNSGPGSRDHDQRDEKGRGAKDNHASIPFQSAMTFLVHRLAGTAWPSPPMSSSYTPRRTGSSALLLRPPRSYRFAPAW